MKKKTVITAVIVLVLLSVVVWIISNNITARRALEYLKTEENCSAVFENCDNEPQFINCIEAYYMQLVTLKSVSITGCLYSFDAPNLDDVCSNDNFRSEYLDLYLHYLCDTYPVPSSEYLSLYANDETYNNFLQCRGDLIAPLFERYLDKSSYKTFEVVNSGDPVLSISNTLFPVYNNYFSITPDNEELIILMDELVQNGDLELIILSDGNYQAAINITESLINELELYGEGITEGFTGDAYAYIDLILSNGDFNLSIDDYSNVMRKFDYIDSNSSVLVRNVTGFTNATIDELEEYAISCDYEGYEDMLMSIVQSIEGAIGNGYYETRVITGYYNFDGVNVVFHTDEGVMNGTYADGTIIMDLIVDGEEHELVFELI